MTDIVRSLLAKNGPCLTSELIRALEESGLSSSAARQRILRSRSEYTRLAGLRFAKNSRFLYLEDQFGTADFWKAIERAFKSHGHAYWAATVGLKARGGRCPRSLFAVVSGAPINRKGQLSPDRILERLCAIQLLEVNSTDDEGDYVRFYPHTYHVISDAASKATMLAESVTLHGVKQWARHLGMGSYGKFALRDESPPPIVSSIAWDISAPSYMRPLARAQDGTIKPGFFVCDVNLHGPVSEDAVAQFVRKHDLASAPLKVAPILPIMIGDVFQEKAFTLARSRGILATTISNLFGTEIAKALRDLIELLTNTGATAAVNPTHLYKVLNSLTKIEGAATRLRGSLFELAIGTLVKDVEGGYLRVGERHTEPFSQRSAEIDVILDRPDGQPVLVIECKSKIPGAAVSQQELEHWYSDRIPLIYKMLSVDSHLKDRTFQFELWSNGAIAPDAETWMKSQNLGFPTFTVSVRDGRAIREYAKKAKSSAIRKILKEHYFHNPLAKLARAPTL